MSSSGRGRHTDEHGQDPGRRVRLSTSVHNGGVLPSGPSGLSAALRPVVTRSGKCIVPFPANAQARVIPCKLCRRISCGYGVLTLCRFSLEFSGQRRGQKLFVNMSRLAFSPIDHTVFVVYVYERTVRRYSVIEWVLFTIPHRHLFWPAHVVVYPNCLGCVQAPVKYYLKPFGMACRRFICKLFTCLSTNRVCFKNQSLALSVQQLCCRTCFIQI